MIEEDQCKRFCGTCPDEECMTSIFYCELHSEICCRGCLQTHAVGQLLNTYEVEKTDYKLQEIKHFATEFVKVNGLSNYRCKLLSPFLTSYGMDKLGRAVPLKDIMGQLEIDSGKVIGSRSFKIPLNYIETTGYGKDRSGSWNYLSEMLDILRKHYGGEERLIPIHVDGDGHCLVHALSRALTGRELFWHGLRKNLYDHLSKDLAKYQEMFSAFHSEEEWRIIINEADPNSTDDGLTVGLGNIHIFALANVLKRPIILLDSPQKMQSSGDYTGLFVPAFTEPSQCPNKSPICIAWSGGAHNHFVPLVAVEGKKLPTIPGELIPGFWGVASEIGTQYVTYNDDGSIPVGEGKPVTTRYLQRLSAAMEKVFVEQNAIPSTLVEEVCRYFFKFDLAAAYKDCDIIEYTLNVILQRRLYRCLECKTLGQYFLEDKDLKPNGVLYDLVINTNGKMEAGKTYEFMDSGIQCSYSEDNKRLEVRACRCDFCSKYTGRLVNADGQICYINGDKTDTPNAKGGKKVYWDGKEYDSEPDRFTLRVGCKENDLRIPVVWFRGESNSDLNSNARAEAERIVSRYWPNNPTDEKLISHIAKLLDDAVESMYPSENLSALLASSSARRRNGSSETYRRSAKNASPATTSSPPLSSSDANDAIHNVVSKLQSLPIAHKRKSNGEPTAVSPASSVQKSPSSDGQITVKISRSRGDTQTLRLDPEISMDALQNRIQELFNIAPDQQILKHGFPPKPLQAPENGLPLGLKSGDKITVSENRLSDTSLNQTVDVAETETITTANFNSLDALRRRFLRGFRESGCSLKWEYAMKKTEEFYPGGYIYEKFKEDIGLEDSRHCHLPLLEHPSFCYNKKHDRVEACFEPYMGHCPINDDIQKQYEKYLARCGGKIQQPSTRLNLKLSPLPSSGAGKSSTLAPGYLTLGDSPALPSEHEKTATRDELFELLSKSKKST